MVDAVAHLLTRAMNIHTTSPSAFFKFSRVLQSCIRNLPCACQYVTRSTWWTTQWLQIVSQRIPENVSSLWSCAGWPTWGKGCARVLRAALQSWVGWSRLPCGGRSGAWQVRCNLVRVFYFMSSYILQQESEFLMCLCTMDSVLSTFSVFLNTLLAIIHSNCSSRTQAWLVSCIASATLAHTTLVSHHFPCILWSVWS